MEGKSILELYLLYCENMIISRLLYCVEPYTGPWITSTHLHITVISQFVIYSYLHFTISAFWQNVKWPTADLLLFQKTWLGVKCSPWSRWKNTTPGRLATPPPSCLHVSWIYHRLPRSPLPPTDWLARHDLQVSSHQEKHRPSTWSHYNVAIWPRWEFAEVARLLTVGDLGVIFCYQAGATALKTCTVNVTWVPFLLSENRKFKKNITKLYIYTMKVRLLCSSRCYYIPDG